MSKLYIYNYYRPIASIISNIDKHNGISYFKKKYKITGNLNVMILSNALVRLLLIQYVNVYDINNNITFSDYVDCICNQYDFNYIEKDLFLEMLCSFYSCNFNSNLAQIEIYNQIISKFTQDDEFYFLRCLINSMPYGAIEYFERKFAKSSNSSDFYNLMKDYNIIEYIFINQMYKHYKNAKDNLFDKFFFQYIRYKNLFHSMLNHSTDIKGFFEFQMFFLNQHSIINTSSLMFTPIFQTYAENNVKYLEIRIGHINMENGITINEIVSTMKRTLKKFVISYRNYLENNHSEYFAKAGIIMHFNKRRDDIKGKGNSGKCWYNFIEYNEKHLLNYAQYREECLINLAVLESIRSTIPYADKYIIAIDAASNELNTEPWIMAPIFRTVKDRWRQDIEKIMDYYDLQYQKCLPLGVTYHVGEVFNSVVSGLRHVDEVVNYYGFQNGERLGHATILGIDTDRYSRDEKIITLPAIELLDNWLWLYDLKAKYNLFKDINIQFIEEKIWGLIHYIYEDENKQIPGHINIHKLYEAYKMQFDNTKIDLKHLKKCSYGSKKHPCYFAEEKDEWSSLSLYYSRHCQCYLNKMNRMVQQEIDNDTQRSIYKEAQTFLKNKIASKGIVIEINPISNTFIGYLENIFDHPVKNMNDTYKDNGVSSHIITTINTDNPGVFGTTLNNQFGIIEQSLLELGHSKEVVLQWLDQIRINGLNSTFIHYKNASKEEIINELNIIEKALNDV